MKIAAEYKIWSAVATDDVRPILNAIRIEATGDADAHGNRPGRALATDGWMLAIVPVCIEADDIVPAQVHYKAFTWAARMTPPKRTRYNPGEQRLGLLAEGVRLSNGVILPAADFYVKGSYPDLAPILASIDAPPKDEWSREERGPLSFGDPLTLDLALLQRVALAIGNGKVRLTQLYRLNTILVETIEHVYPVAPFGALMPMAGGDADKLRQRWSKKPKPVEKVTRPVVAEAVAA